MKVLSTRTLGKEGHFGPIKDGLAREWGQRNEEILTESDPYHSLAPIPLPTILTQSVLLNRHNQSLISCVSPGDLWGRNLLWKGGEDVSVCLNETAIHA